MKSVVVTLPEEAYEHIEEIARNKKMPMEKFLSDELLQRFCKPFILCEVCENRIPDDPVYRLGLKVVQCPYCGEEMEFELAGKQDDTLVDDHV